MRHLDAESDRCWGTRWLSGDAVDLTNLILIAIVVACSGALFLFMHQALRSRSARISEAEAKKDYAATGIAQVRLAMRNALKSGAQDATKSVWELKSNYQQALGGVVDDAIVDEWTRFIMGIPFDTVLADGSFRGFYTMLETLRVPKEKYLISSVPDKLLRLAAYEDLATGKDEYPAGKISNAPIILKKDEKLVACFDHVRLVRNVNHTEYVGQSAGISVRVAKGISLRSGSFRGTPIKTKVPEVAGTGNLAIGRF